jgi:hypothetical protein
LVSLRNPWCRLVKRHRSVDPRNRFLIPSRARRASQRIILLRPNIQS